jgi:hypothetical protein
MDLSLALDRHALHNHGFADDVIITTTHQSASDLTWAMMI